MEEVSKENTRAILDWAVQYGIDGLRARTESYVAIKKEGATTLAVLLAGVGAGLAYAAKGVELGQHWIAWGAGLFAAYLAVLSIVLVVAVLRTRTFPALYTLPNTIAESELSLDQMKAEEVKSLNRRILAAVDAVSAASAWLNGVRFAACLSPIVAVGVAVWAGQAVS